MKGTIAGGRAQITSEQAAVERARAGQNEFNEITARDLKVNFGSDVNKGQWTFSIGQTQARSGGAFGVEFTAALVSNQ